MRKAFLHPEFRLVVDGAVEAAGRLGAGELLWMSVLWQLKVQVERMVIGEEWLR